MQEKRFPDTKNSLLHTLSTEDLIKNYNKNWDILNLGAILFCKDIRNFKDLKRKAIRVIVYKETSRINAIKEQEGIKGYASGFEGLISYIMDQLPSNEIIENALRKIVKVYPEVAIREFVANALIHQDFTITGAGIMIEIFSDRLEITNPGIPLVDINRFIDTAPKSRNEKLANLMRMMGICEERGSGIDKVIASIEVYQLPAPKFIAETDYFKVVLFAPLSFEDMDKQDRIRATYQHCCLKFMNQEFMTNSSLRERFGISDKQHSKASKIISDTLEVGLIKPSDPENKSTKHIKYVPFFG